MAEQLGCLYCKYSSAIVQDNHGGLHTLCVCFESKNFLKPIDIAFDRCDFEEREEEENEAD